MNKTKKVSWKPGNMVYPLPAVMVSCGDEKTKNIVTVGWTGTICTNPAMTYISLRTSRYSYDIIKQMGYFVINLTTKKLAYATDLCGVKSGRDIDKFKEAKLTPTYDESTGCVMIEESPVSIICKTVEIKELGSHHMFIANVISVNIDEKYLDDTGRFNLNDSELIAYSHGKYFGLGEELGGFGYSVKKNKESNVNKNTTQISKNSKREKALSKNKSNKNNKKSKSKQDKLNYYKKK